MATPAHEEYYGSGEKHEADDGDEYCMCFEPVYWHYEGHESKIWICDECGLVHE